MAFRNTLRWYVMIDLQYYMGVMPRHRKRKRRTNFSALSASTTKNTCTKSWLQASSSSRDKSATDLDKYLKQWNAELLQWMQLPLSGKFSEHTNDKSQQLQIEDFFWNKSQAEEVSDKEDFKCSCQLFTE
eukprot:15364597-Ditylum_brightwellii.AAC.1